MSLDILYGHSAALQAGYHVMAHKTGFTEKSLNQALLFAGYTSMVSKRRLQGLDLWEMATKLVTPEDVLKNLAGKFFSD